MLNSVRYGAATGAEEDIRAHREELSSFGKDY
jgi:hypothetical protein